jgi:NTE family protein
VEAAAVKTAFVLGGGGVLGAHEVGMLRALSEAGISPDVVVGTPVGAINGALVAADPADLAQLGYRARTGVAASIERAYQASARYLAGLA